MEEKFAITLTEDQFTHSTVHSPTNALFYFKITLKFTLQYT